jgi:Tfp pilus assembly protein PilF
MVDDIINALESLRDLVVIARSSTQTFARAPLDVRRIHYELDVRYVLHGSVRRSTDALRISVELSEAPSGQVIWSERFDGQPDHLFDLQDHIAASVATAIAPHLRGRELNRALRKHPNSMTAYDLTLRALDQLNRMDRECLLRARELLSEATVLDPDYGPAYSRLASLYLRGIAQGWSDDVAADREMAESAARLAIDRDPNDPVGLAIYGHIQSYLRKDYKTALEYLKQAQLVGPNCPRAWGYSSLTHGYLGDYAAAVEDGERAVRLSPVGPEAFWFEHYLAQAYYLSGRYEDAVGWARMSDVHNGGIAANQRVLMASLVALGDIEEARRIAAQVQRISPNFRLSAFSMATPLPETVKELFIHRLREAGLPD